MAAESAVERDFADAALRQLQTLRRQLRAQTPQVRAHRQSEMTAELAREMDLVAAGSARYLRHRERAAGVVVQEVARGNEP